MYPHTHHLTDQPILDVRHLTVVYGQLHVVDDLTFHLHPGERVAVVGPNGAGKSTLFKVVAGVLPPTSGEVQIYGNGPSKHLCIAYIPQRTASGLELSCQCGRCGDDGAGGKMKPFSWPTHNDYEAVTRHWKPLIFVIFRNGRSASFPAGSSSACSSRAPWHRRPN